MGQAATIKMPWTLVRQPVIPKVEYTFPLLLAGFMGTVLM